MKRCLLIFLLMLLPLQFSWAAVAAFCQHDKEANTQHFGHHDPYGHTEADLKKTDSKSEQSSDFSSDADCAFCHLGCNKQVGVQSNLLPRLTLQNSFTLPPPASYLSHIGESPEKPDWLRLA